jgi:predicted flap endonuclease-1-like 5' DNA nuclease
MESIAAIIQTNWPLVGLVVVLALFAALWLLSRGKTRRRERHRAPDALDEGVAPASRNQALIDAHSAVTVASLADTGPDILAGMGEAIAIGATQAAAAAASADDLTRIKGLGPRLAALLATLGVTRFSQIAGWDDNEIERIDAQLGAFKGRIRRDNWVEQARYLAAGDQAGFEARFGKL